MARLVGGRRRNFQGVIGLSDREAQAAAELGHPVQGDSKRQHLVEKDRKKAGQLAHRINTKRRYDK